MKWSVLLCGDEDCMWWGGGASGWDIGWIVVALGGSGVACLSAGGEGNQVLAETIHINASSLMKSLVVTTGDNFSSSNSNSDITVNLPAPVAF